MVLNLMSLVLSFFYYIRLLLYRISGSIVASHALVKQRSVKTPENYICISTTVMGKN